MAHAYTPGLRVTRRATITKRRVLPLKGNVIAKVGEQVARDLVVARTELPGNVEIINVVSRLGIEPDDIDGVMIKKEGQPIRKGEIIAKTRGLFGLFKSSIESPLDGSVESISKITGQVLLRDRPIPVEVRAYINGVVTAVHEGEGVDVTAEGTFVQGIFGIGGEVWGPLRFAATGPEQVLQPDDLKPEHKDAIVVGGAFASHACIRKAIQLGAAGLIVGGIHDEDLRQILGYDLGVAITGAEKVGLTLVLTEGFGQIRMSDRTWETLKSREGDVASMSGATQIRAGVMRPEIIIPYTSEQVRPTRSAEAAAGSAIDIGANIRIIRQPHFGRVGVVHNLPSALQKIESETMARVLEVKFPDGQVRTIPRANVELIEE